MSKNKSLSPDQIEEMKSMVKGGTGPQKIADSFGVGVSTVHNYKKRFKAEGMKFESVRGRQAGTTNLSSEAKKVPGNHKNSNTPVTIRNTSEQPTNTFIVNGIPINITSEAKSVNINKTPKGITFVISL